MSGVDHDGEKTHQALPLPLPLFASSRGPGGTVELLHKFTSNPPHPPQ